jgi:hypothetical protein
MSSNLSSLKLTSAKRQLIQNPIEFRRQKLSNKLKEQIALATAMKNGTTYTAKRLRAVTDSDGVRQTVEVSKRVKPIWFTQNNKLFVQVKYGSKVVPLTSKGDKNSVEVTNADDLIQVLEKLNLAVLGGELDTQIEIASESVRTRFQKI